MPMDCRPRLKLGTQLRIRWATAMCSLGFVRAPTEQWTVAAASPGGPFVPIDLPSPGQQYAVRQWETGPFSDTREVVHV